MQKSRWKGYARWMAAGMVALVAACGGGGGGSSSPSTTTPSSSTPTGGGSGGSTPSTGTLALLAGNADGAGNVDGTGTAARFYAPYVGAADSAGNLYVLDTNNGLIRRVTPSGEVTTVRTYASAGISFPSGVCVDPSGTLYVSHDFQHSITRIPASGGAAVYAGSSTPGSNDGTGTAASFNTPKGIACDASGNVYVADSANHTVRKIAPGGVVTTLAGLALTMGSADGTGAAARFITPHGVAADASGSVWVSDTNNHTIRKITSGGVVSTVAGVAGTSGSANGNGTAARFYSPRSIAVDAAGNAYVEDNMNGALRKVTPAGDVTTLIGGGTAGLQFSAAAGAANVAYAISREYHAVYKADGTTVTVFAGKPGRAAHLDATGSTALFNGPQGVAVSTDGSLRVVEGAGTLRAVSTGGVVTTVAGSATISGSADGTGTDARFLNPRGAAMDTGGNVYVADMSNHTIRMITPTGVVSTLAGSAGVSGSADGTGSAARFFNPQGLAVDTAGNVYVADSSNHAIRKITPGGVVTTLAGDPTALAGFTDGTGGAARFSSPSHLAIDSSGTLYVTDDSYNTVRKVTAAGVVSTLAGVATTAGSADGNGTAARLFGPKGMAVDAGGNVYVADTGNHTLRKISTTGAVTTVAGVASQASFEPGALPGRLSAPKGVAVDGNRIYITVQNGVVVVNLTP